MTSLSNYVESGLLRHLFRQGSFPKPSAIAIALTSTAPSDSDTGATIQEIPSGINGSGTGYARLYLGDPDASGDSIWTHSVANIDAGSGVITNTSNFTFNTALVDWGWVSGVVVLDNPYYGSGNVIMSETLSNARVVYMGDGIRFDPDGMQIQFK